MPELKTKGFSFEIKLLDAAGEFEGLGSVYSVQDEQNDVVEPGAFTQTIKQNKGRVPLLWNHKLDEVIGVAELTDTSQGLHVKGKLNLEVAKAKEVYALLKQGAVKGLSIGYDTIKSTWEGTIRHLKELRLWEMTVTPFPAQPLALIETIKRLGPTMGKPFGQYSSFADCVAANQDKDNPEGFCAYLEHQATGSWPGQASMDPMKAAAGVEYTIEELKSTLQQLADAETDAQKKAQYLLAVRHLEQGELVLEALLTEAVPDTSGTGTATIIEPGTFHSMIVHLQQVRSELRMHKARITA